MTVARSIVRTAFMVKELAAWLEDDVHKGGFCEPGSMSEMDLTLAASTFRHLADTCDERRQSLLANAPGPFESDATAEAKAWARMNAEGFRPQPLLLRAKEESNAEQ